MLARPFFSIVTISYNQAKFLPSCIQSIASQDFNDFEYIVQDPGSCDGSRDILLKYNDLISLCLLEPDHGPADGLNRAFAYARGEYFLFVNSDDRLAPGALRKLHEWITQDNHKHHVYSGACRIINDSGFCIRNAFSDSMNLKRAAYGQSILIQPSTAFSSKVYYAVEGFNSLNTSNWDGEFFIDAALKGFRFVRRGYILSDYRIHSSSLTGAGNMNVSHRQHSENMYTKITGLDYSQASKWIRMYYWLERKLANPFDTYERILKGSVYMRESR